MNEALVIACIDSTRDVFSKMIECQLIGGDMETKVDDYPAFEISGVISIAGRISGMLVVSLRHETAVRVGSEFIGAESGIADADAIDAIGEIANMVAGGVKARLTGWELCIGLPTVLCGQHHAIRFPARATPITLRFDSKWGPVAIEVGLVAEDAKLAI